ncbi:helix-turn-helix domain-containing protein [Sansalvadorimonas verongulae]|uniref:helix-turn-helix domain-containing protein n=1 Tax=Sansalvadorimonas verongulae TaxID=2172824 RepID=UPI0012BB9FAF|nr:helix-turn-helix transcriptional regulator [Sansalvadorimonas verongulae]MTI13807.1 helix-turn-helix domain-containing protein [Sansalvadorimonas verongulae]
MGKTPTRGIGPKIAREIEAACEKPHGWLDAYRHSLDEDTNHQLADRIAEAICSSDRSQRQIAIEIGVPPQTITKWIRSGSISKHNVSKLAEATSVNTYWLLTGDTEHSDNAISAPTPPQETWNETTCQIKRLVWEALSCTANIKHMQDSIRQQESKLNSLKSEILAVHTRFNDELFNSFCTEGSSDSLQDFVNQELPYTFLIEDVLITIPEDAETADHVGIEVIPRLTAIVPAPSAEESEEEEPAVEESDANVIGSRIATLRKDKGWSQDQLADAIWKQTETRITQQSIHRIETGETKNPRRLKAFAETLGVTEKFIRFGDD